MNIAHKQPLYKQKKVWVMAAGVFIILLLTVLWLLAVQRHSQRMSQVDKQYEAVKGTASVLAANSTASRSKRLMAIEQLSMTNILSSDPCDGTWWEGWYQAVDTSVQAARTRCVQKYERIQQIATTAKRAFVYLNDEATISQLLSILRPASGDKAWQTKALASAESVQGDIEAINPTDDTKKLLTVAKQKVAAIITAWERLNAASNKEDKTSYLKAKTSLEQAYAELGEISDVSDEQVENVIIPLQKAVTEL